MSNCTKTLCNGTLEEKKGPYGSYWKCSKCGHTVSKKCICGGTRILTYYGKNAVTRCQKCGTYKY